MYGERKWETIGEFGEYETNRLMGMAKEESYSRNPGIRQQHLQSKLENRKLKGLSNKV